MRNLSKIKTYATFIKNVMYQYTYRLAYFIHATALVCSFHTKAECFIQCLCWRYRKRIFVLRLRSHGTERIRDRTQIRPVTAVHTKPDKLQAKKCSHGAGRIRARSSWSNPRQSSWFTSFLFGVHQLFLDNRCS